MDSETIILECMVCGVSSNSIKRRLFSSLVNTGLCHTFKLISGLDEIYQTDNLCAACVKSLKLVSKFYESCLQSKTILLRKQPISLLCNLKTADKSKLNIKTDTNQSSKSNEQKDESSLFKWPSLSPKASTSNSTKDDDGSGKNFFVPTKEESNDVASIDSDWFHEMKERVKRRKKYYCEECEIGIDTNVQWLKHLKKIHHSAEKTFICDHCGKSWSDSQNFIDHVRTHTQESHGKPFQCNYCSTRFARQHTLKKHIRSHENLRNFKCEHCNKAFNFDDSLKDHVQRVHLQIYKFFCEMCPSKFYDKQGLEYHKKVHTGSKDSQCPYCEESFYSNSDRNSHCRKKHSDKPVPKGKIVVNKVI